MRKTEESKAMEALELAAAVKAWRRDMTTARAALVLGIPKRTLEGIEQGRGFRHPILLMHAIRSFEEQLPMAPVVARGTSRSTDAG